MAVSPHTTQADYLNPFKHAVSHVIQHYWVCLVLSQLLVSTPSTLYVLFRISYGLGTAVRAVSGQDLDGNRLEETTMKPL